MLTNMDTKMLLERNGGVCQVSVSVADTGVSWSFDQRGLQHTDEIRTRLLLKPRILSEVGECRLVVQYAKVVELKKNNFGVRCAETVFLGSYDDCDLIKKSIETVLRSKESHRPKRMLLFINPKSGFQTAVRDYHAVVAPLMTRCGVDVHPIVTKSANHAADILADYDLTSIDLVASMGGDGSVVQVTNGLIRRTMNDAHADIDDPNVELIKPSLPFATIPSGSGCGVAWLTSGAVMDIETSVFAIILGLTKPYDVVELRHEGKRLGFGNMAAGCGVISNVYMWLEKVKWMGKHRYWFVLPKGWWSWLNFDVVIDYLPATDKDRSTQSKIKLAYTTTSREDNLTDEADGWKTLRCKATEVFFSTVDISKLGEAVFASAAHIKVPFSTGVARLTIIKGANFWQTMNGYRYLMGLDKTPRSYVETIEVTKARIRGIQDWTDASVGLAMLVDGEKMELRHGATCEMRMNHGLLTVLAMDRDLIDDIVADQR